MTHITERHPVESPVRITYRSGLTRTGVVKGWPSGKSVEVEFRSNGSLWRETVCVSQVT